MFHQNQDTHKHTHSPCNAPTPPHIVEHQWDVAARCGWAGLQRGRERESEWVSETERGTWRAQIEVRWLINCLPCFLLLRQTPCLVFLSPASSSLPFPPLSANGQLCQRRCHLQHPLRNTPNQLPTQKNTLNKFSLSPSPPASPVVLFILNGLAGQRVLNPSAWSVTGMRAAR